MPGQPIDGFPLFPLGIVALPDELVPLHIFEERYKALVEHCLDAESEFGVIWQGEDELHAVGCACEIVEVVERLADGRVNLVARGTRPFRLLERTDHLPFPAGTVAFLPEAADEVDGSAAALTRELYAELVERATERRPDPLTLAAMGAYAMAGTVDFGPEAKQGLLELRSEDARLHLLTRLFRAAMKRLELVTRAQERARSNGKVRFT